jgi:hypothetical protein
MKLTSTFRSSFIIPMVVFISLYGVIVFASRTTISNLHVPLEGEVALSSVTW